MLKKCVPCGLALVALFVVAAQSRPVGAALIDRLIIKNNTAGGAVYYVIHKSMGSESGCIQPHHTFSDGFLLQPKGVIISAFKSYSDCVAGHSRSQHSQMMDYWAPETTYTVTGRYDEFHVSTHH
jgi:hypothetical protein